MDFGKLLHDPLVFFIIAALYVFGRDLATGALRRDAKAKLEDKDPTNDKTAHTELAAADAIDRLPGGIPRIGK